MPNTQLHYSSLGDNQLTLPKNFPPVEFNASPQAPQGGIRLPENLPHDAAPVPAGPAPQSLHLPDTSHHIEAASRVSNPTIYHNDSLSLLYSLGEAICILAVLAAVIVVVVRQVRYSRLKSAIKNQTKNISSYNNEMERNGGFLK